MSSASSNISGVDSDILAQFSSNETKTLLDTIDSLRELGLGRRVDLPQIIVVGDQSTGKSSVLESLSRMPFPSEEGICTRFPTELKLRTSKETRVNVSIQYTEKSESELADDRQPPFRKSGFDRDALPEFIKEAKDRMKIGKDGFSNDILRVEIYSPDVDSLTLVDLPGFYRTATDKQGETGKRIVNEIIDTFMRQERSIILAVVTANHPYASQATLGVAALHDSTKQRTIGVITKPDLAGDGLGRQGYIDLAMGLDTMHKLSLGWFVLRNRTENEKTQSFEERDATERKLFKSFPWSTIPSSQRGAENLRKKLAKVLLDHVKKSLPDVIREIDDILDEDKTELRRLGKSRSNTEDQRLYMLSISETFNRLANDAIGGRYSDSFFGDIEEDANKLRATLRGLNQAFCTILSRKGRTYDIEKSDHSDDELSTNEDDDQLSTDEDGEFQYLQPFLNHYAHLRKPESITQEALKLKIASLEARNLGRELPGTPNSELALQLFKMQMRPWREIAQCHLNQALEHSKAFVERLFSHIVGSDGTSLEAILKECVDPFFDSKREALEVKLQELLRPYERGYGLPLETQFHKALSKATLDRLGRKLVALLEEKFTDAFEEKSKKALRPHQILDAISGSEELQSGEFGKEIVIDMMEAYYQMSLTTFTDNVINLAIESCLVCDIPDILAPAKVYKMNKVTLETLAAESEEVLEKRVILADRVRILEDGLKKCRQSRLRGAVGP
ncbi:dynamin family protein [Thozetella sp. PMI_491]|nr:dynamin family protein [Thozetella sp. PMI_491]